MQLKPAGHQAGITLIESLIAVVIAALGILGVLGMQMRTLADTQTGVRRAQAIRLIEDLSERTRANPNSLAVLAKYSIPWGSSASNAKDCTTSECEPAEMSAYDMQQWVASVRQTLPGSTYQLAIVSGEHHFDNVDNERLLLIGIGWRENEKSSDTDYDHPLTGKTDSGPAWANGCPAGKTCHFQLISLSGRCVPYSVPAQFFCPGQ